MEDQKDYTPMEVALALSIYSRDNAPSMRAAMAIEGCRIDGKAAGIGHGDLSFILAIEKSGWLAALPHQAAKAYVGMALASSIEEARAVIDGERQLAEMRAALRTHKK